MIFVTLGSQKFQFNRLLKAIDGLIKDNLLADNVFAQSGYSDYKPQYYSYKQFLDRDEFAQMENMADIVITHGGTGAIIGAIKKGKKIIAIPRLEKYGEHVDDHQLQIIKQFSDMNLIEPCYDLKQLEQSLITVRSKKYNAYRSNTETIVNSIDNFIKGCISL